MAKEYWITKSNTGNELVVWSKAPDEADLEHFDCYIWSHVIEKSAYTKAVETLKEINEAHIQDECHCTACTALKELEE